MNATEIKQKLVEQISEIEDAEFLNAIMQIVSDNNPGDRKTFLTEWQKKRIADSQNQIKAGECFTDEQANEIIEKWLNE